MARNTFGVKTNVLGGPKLIEAGDNGVGRAMGWLLLSRRLVMVMTASSGMDMVTAPARGLVMIISDSTPVTVRKLVGGPPEFPSP